MNTGTLRPSANLASASSSRPPRSSRPARGSAEVVVPIRMRTTVRATEASSTTPIVACPRLNATVDATECSTCPCRRSFEWGLRGGEVHCLLGNQTAPDPRADTTELASRALVRDVAAPNFSCVTPDVPLSRLRSHFRTSRARAVAVVDPDGRLAGIVSRSDLLETPEKGTVADIMAPLVHALPEDAPVTFAVGLLTQHDVSEIPLVSADGTVTGLCYSLDVVRWLADRLGYVWPSPSKAAR